VAESEGAGLIDALIYLPLDFPWIVGPVMKKVDPLLFVIVEKEYWPNILRSATKRSVPVMVVNGTISEHSFKGYRRALWFFTGIFGSLSYFCARTQVDAEHATTLGARSDKVEVLGNLKFDMAKPSSTISTEELAKALEIDSNDLVIVAGSTHPGEEEFFIDIFGELKDELPNLKMILAPRHPERFAQVAKMVEASGLKLSLRSRATSVSIDSEVIVLDTLGELFTAYSLSSVAFVGGSLVDIGGHNLFEPAFFSKPVLFGPHIYTCIDMAEAILAEEAGVKVNDKEELKRVLKELLTDAEERRMMGERAALLLDSLRGTTLKTVERLENIISLK
jgi:3-deoxy-D-manno-octulosonic-acid transferase